MILVHFGCGEGVRNFIYKISHISFLESKFFYRCVNILCKKSRLNILEYLW